MKMTLLAMTQNILSAMDSDDINSIGDTVESVQVANIIKETYYELFDVWTIPSFNDMIELTPASDPTNPTKMTLPENFINIDWMKYNWHEQGDNDWRDINYLTPLEFQTLGTNRSLMSDSVVAVGEDNVPIFILNDQGPTYWTSFNNVDLYFDSYNSALESTVEAVNVMCYGQTSPDFTITDAFIPVLDVQQFPLLLSEAKSVCFVDLKQAPNQKEEQRSRRQQVHIQNNRWRAQKRQYLENEPNYGRKTAPSRAAVFQTIGR